MIKIKTWTKEEVKFLEDNYLTMSYREVAEYLGKTEGSIRNAIWRHFPKKQRRWTQAEEEWLVDQYARCPGNECIDLISLAKKLERLKSNVCRKAKDMGLNTNYFRGRTEAEKVKMSHRMTERLRTTNQPSGSGKCGKRKDLEGAFFRSTWEANYARVLKHTNTSFQFEPKSFTFEGETRGAITYLPDFYLPATDQWCEVKGYLDPKSKSKIRKFKKFYPNEFDGMVMVIDKKRGKAYDWLVKLGIKHFISYNELEKTYKDTIPNWEAKK